MKSNLGNELIELSHQVRNHCKIKTISKITGTIELSGDVILPYHFECEALHPGIFKGFTIEESEIMKAVDTIFKQTDVFRNDEINKDHKSSRKEDSSVDDLLGKVTNAKYDISKKAYILSGDIYDAATAYKVANGLIKYVSLRINPNRIEYLGNNKFARDLTFEELSFVRAPGDPNAKILNQR